MTHPCGCTSSSTCEVAERLIPKCREVYAAWVADKSERNERRHEEMQERYKAHFDVPMAGLVNKETVKGGDTK